MKVRGGARGVAQHLRVEGVFRLQILLERIARVHTNMLTSMLCPSVNQVGSDSTRRSAEAMVQYRPGRRLDRLDVDNALGLVFNPILYYCDRPIVSPHIINMEIACETASSRSMRRPGRHWTTGLCSWMG